MTENKDGGMQNAPRKRRKAVMVLFSIIGIVFICLLLIMANSPGKLAPLKDGREMPLKILFLKRYGLISTELNREYLFGEKILRIR